MALPVFKTGLSMHVDRWVRLPPSPATFLKVVGMFFVLCGKLKNAKDASDGQLKDRTTPSPVVDKGADSRRR